MVKYSLHNNPLTENGDYVAIPQEVENFSIEDVINQITGPGSILKKTECRAVIYAFLDQVADNAGKGIGMVSPYLMITPGLSGVFLNDQDSFDGSRHSRELHINPGTLLRKSIENMEFEKIPFKEKRPVIVRAMDDKTNVINHTITPGHLLVINGEQLKVTDTEDKNQGVLLIDSASGKATRITHLKTNNPKTIEAYVPDAQPGGTYQLVIKTIYPNCKTLKEGKLDQPLTIK